MTRLRSQLSVEALGQKRMNAADLMGGILAALPATPSTVQGLGRSRVC